MSKGKTPLGPTGVVMDFTLIHVYNSSHGWKKDQILAGEKLKRRVYTQGYADIGWVPLFRRLWGSLRRSCFAISCSVQGTLLNGHQSLQGMRLLL